MISLKKTERMSIVCARNHNSSLDLTPYELDSMTSRAIAVCQHLTWAINWAMACAAAVFFRNHFRYKFLLHILPGSLTALVKVVIRTHPRRRRHKSPWQ